LIVFRKPTTFIWDEKNKYPSLTISEEGLKVSGTASGGYSIRGTEESVFFFCVSSLSSFLAAPSVSSHLPFPFVLFFSFF
jgi:hypothetical protein